MTSSVIIKMFFLYVHVMMCSLIALLDIATSETNMSYPFTVDAHSFILPLATSTQYLINLTRQS